MDHGKKKSAAAREVAKKGTPLSLAIALAAAGGIVVGSAGTYILFKPLPTPTPNQSAAPAAAATPPAPNVTMTPQQQPQYTPAPQPPGEAPPGKVWSVEHGHWHDAPAAVVTPTPAAPVVNPFAPPTPAPAAPTLTPVVPTTPAPAVAPAEKKE